MNMRELAQQVGVTDAHLSRVVRRADYKTVSAGLAQRIALALGLPGDYFAETREGYVIKRVRNDPALRDRLFDRLQRDGR